MYTSIKKFKNCVLLTEVCYDLEEINIYEKAKKHHKNKLDLNHYKLFNNMIRAKTKVFDYAFNNDFDYFFTLTINDNYSRNDYNSVFRLVSRKFRDLRKIYDGLEYLVIPEKHKDGINYHFHGLLKGNLDNEIYINSNGFFSFKAFDFIGFNNIQHIKNKEAVSNYITKYITKGQIDTKGFRSYFVSRGLKLPSSAIIKSKLPISWTFENEYCKKTKLTFEEFNNLMLQFNYNVDFS